MVEQVISPCPAIRGATPDGGVTPSMDDRDIDSCVAILFRGLPTGAYSVSRVFPQDSHPNSLFSQRLIACVIIVYFALYIGVIRPGDSHRSNHALCIQRFAQVPGKIGTNEEYRNIVAQRRELVKL